MPNIVNHTSFSTEELMQRFKDLDFDFFYERHLIVRISDDVVIFEEAQI